MPLKIPPPIESQRLILRMIERRDLPALMRAYGDVRVAKYLPFPAWTSLEDGENWFERITRLQASDGILLFVLVEKNNMQPIGTVVLFHHDEPSQRAEVGYVLEHDFWGRGLMLEALHAIAGEAFRSLNLRRLEAEVNPENTSSVRLLQRLGFVQEGLLRQRWIESGKPSDAAMFGLLKDEYLTPRQFPQL